MEIDPPIACVRMLGGVRTVIQSGKSILVVGLFPLCTQHSPRLLHSFMAPKGIHGWIAEECKVSAGSESSASPARAGKGMHVPHTLCVTPDVQATASGMDTPTIH